MLVKLMRALEAVPEASGFITENTLIVYSSNNAEKQHADDAEWPVVLLGNARGRLNLDQIIADPTHCKAGPGRGKQVRLLRSPASSQGESS